MAELLGLAQDAASNVTDLRLGAASKVYEAAFAKLGTTGPHCAARHHLSTAHASVGVGRGLAEPAAADEVSAPSKGRGVDGQRRVQSARLLGLRVLALLVLQLASN